MRTNTEAGVHACCEIMHSLKKKDNVQFVSTFSAWMIVHVENCLILLRVLVK